MVLNSHTSLCRFIRQLLRCWTSAAWQLSRYADLKMGKSLSTFFIQLLHWGVFGSMLGTIKQNPKGPSYHSVLSVETVYQQKGFETTSFLKSGSSMNFCCWATEIRLLLTHRKQNISKWVEHGLAGTQKTTWPISVSRNLIMLIIDMSLTVLESTTLKSH